MLKLKVSKQTRSEASKLKEKFSINKKTHLVTEKNFVLHHTLKINKRGDPNKLQEGRKKKGKINKHPPGLLGT